MADDLQQLKERLVKLSDDELIAMVLSPSGEYRQDAIDIAKNELKWRNVEIPTADDEPETGVDPASNDPVAGELPRGRPAIPENVCLVCGSAMRQGTLVAERELTVVFADNHEERFVRVNACTRCGQLSMVVDFETDVQQ